MSRRASLALRGELSTHSDSCEDPWQKPEQLMTNRVRFPNELIFLENLRDKDFDTAQEMLRRASLKIDINGITPSGLTALHQACFDQNIQAVKLLLQNGAKINQPDADMWTPLHAACEIGNLDIVKCLVESGADLYVRNDANEFPVDLVKPNNSQLMRYLSPSYSGKKFKKKMKKEKEKEQDKDKANKSKKVNDDFL